MLIDDRLISKPLYDSQCLRCEHLIEGPAGAKCKAFPNGIDVKFILNETIHDKIMSDQEGEYIFRQKSFAKSLRFFGKIVTLFKGVQENLFTGQTDEHGNQLLPSKKDPSVRRYQKNSQIEMEGLGPPKMKGSEDYLKPKGKDEKTTPLFNQEIKDKNQIELEEQNVYKFENDGNNIFNDSGKLEYIINADGSASVMALNAFVKRQGVGTALVNEFEQYAMNIKIKVIDVPASPTKEAVSFWNKMGYEPVGGDNKKWFKKIMRSDYEGSYDTESGIVLMTKKLADDSAENFAKAHHKNQKYGDEGDYFENHIKPVVETALKLGKGRNDLNLIKKVAYLHDIIEDTKVDINDLRKLFGEDVLKEVKLLSKKSKLTGTRKSDEDYYGDISKSDVAKIVKNADRLENIKNISGIKNTRFYNKIIKEYEAEIPLFEKYGMGVGLREAMIEAKHKPRFLNEKDFYENYYQHKLIRKEIDADIIIDKIKKEGFKPGIGPNALPSVFMRGKPTNSTMNHYGQRAGDVIILVPKEFIIEYGNGPRVKEGFRPKDYEVLRIEKDYQDLYELYKDKFPKT